MHNIRLLEKRDEKKVKILLKELTDKTINFKSELLMGKKNIHCLVIEDAGNIIGFGALAIYPIPTKGLVGRVEDVVVSSQYRGRGLGRELMQSLIDIAKKEKLESLFLNSHPSRIPARKLYASLGFKLFDTGFFWMDL